MKISKRLKVLSLKVAAITGVAIDRLVILSSGIYVDTSADTDVSEAILQHALTWASSEFGVAYCPEMIKRPAHL
jgi:hypothetical protein